MLSSRLTDPSFIPLTIVPFGPDYLTRVAALFPVSHAVRQPAAAGARPVLPALSQLPAIGSGGHARPERDLTQRPVRALSVWPGRHAELPAARLPGALLRALGEQARAGPVLRPLHR